MRALLVDHNVASGLRLGETAEPLPGPNQALIRVAATSLNFGEITHAVSQAPDGAVLGWDAAGVVERAAADGSGPAAGTQVLTLGDTGGWAEFRAVDTGQLGVAPAGSDPGALSTLPVTATTALRALRKFGSLNGKRVLITGSTGGVGQYAVQLAHLGGAHVIASTSNPAAQGNRLRSLGADEVISGPEHVSTSLDGVVDCVGGPQLAQAFDKLASHGTLVAVGDVTMQPVEFPPGAFLGNNGRHGRSIVTFHLADGPLPGEDLTWLAERLAAKDFMPHISWRGDWDQADEAVAAVLDRNLRGKAVLDIS
ncbi:zinc-binding dehydrogenase [Streptomyces sp. NPDC058459]|uniref:zinc-binding dehydrogenase n=1 Tax=Streptomyces sp. NPDC058459 TaxID=3346508 RepID=UPI003665A2AA